MTEEIISLGVFVVVHGLTRETGPAPFVWEGLSWPRSWVTVFGGQARGVGLGVSQPTE